MRAELAFLSTPTLPFDLQLADTAPARGLTLVTHNRAEFERVPDLALEDGWFSP